MRFLTKKFFAKQPKRTYQHRVSDEFRTYYPQINTFSYLCGMLQFVDENIIDAIIEQLDTAPDEHYEQQMEAFAEAQPVVVSYLFDEETFHLLTEDEKGFMQYLCLIIWMALTQVNGQLEPVSEDMIGEAEEKNYGILEATTGKTFRQRLDPFFEGYPQEDLLAFAEEAVLEDENDPEALVTKEGREPIFIAVKSVIDVLIGLNV
jgi:hypothetical protein